MSPVLVLLFAATLYNLVLAAIILLHKRGHRTGGSFAWYIIFTAAWTLCVAVMQIPGDTARALLLARGTFFFASLIAISGLWFVADFPLVSRRFRGIATVMTVLGLPWLFICWTPFLLPSVRYEPWGVNPVVNFTGIGLYTVWIGSCIAASIIHLLYKAANLRGFERLQVRYILLGIVGLMAGAIPSLILPVITHETRYGLYGPLSTLFLATSTTYAIVRYRLMDINIVLRAGVIYSVTIGFLSLAFALLVPAFDTLLSTYCYFPSRTGSFLVAFLIALTFQPLRQLVQQEVDRRFFKSVYDYRIALREAGNALASVYDRESLVHTVITALDRTLRPSVIAVFLPGHDEVLTQTHTTSAWELLPHTLSRNDPMLTYAMETDEVLVTDEMIRQSGPSHEVGRYLEAWRVAVVLPLIAGDWFCGLVCMGEKRSGDVYTADDIGLLRILGKQAAIALDNARHYDEVALMNEYHERLLYAMQDGVIALDPQRRVITFNRGAERITGIEASAAEGRSLEAIGLTTLPLRTPDGTPVETTVARDNVDIPVLVTVTPFLRRWEVENSHLLVIRDLSAIRALEQEKMQAERFSSMGAMAASLAHEIKNPLVPIQMFAHMLPTRYDDAEFRKEFSVTVVNEVERINRLVGQMLDLVRQPDVDRKPVDVREVVERLLTLLQPECARHQIRIERVYGPSLPPIAGVVGQIYQAILNVLTNAVQAMPSGGTLTVELSETAGQLICCISDTGTGVPASDLPRIFEPLYTTKVRGHGLGLALTYQFIRSHGGDIHAASPPGSGLVVTMTLPAGHVGLEAERLCS